MDRLKYRPMRRPLTDLLRWAFNRKPRWGRDYAEDERHRDAAPAAEPEAKAATAPEKDHGGQR